jgi:hypothetical protein
VQALRDLAHVEPLEGEDLAHLKNRLAAGAAEALELQLRWDWTGGGGEGVGGGEGQGGYREHGVLIVHLCVTAGGQGG